MKKILLMITVVFLFSCKSEYQRQLEQGAKNWCECKAVDRELKNDPENYDLIEKRARLLRTVDTNKELSGDEAQFEKDIKELTKNC